MSDQMSMGEELLERYDVSLLEQRFLDFGITLTKEQKIQFLQYYEHLVEKNQVMNLTAITESEQTMAAYLQNSFFSAGYLMAASIVALKCLNLVPDLAAWMIPEGDTAFSTRNFGEGVAQQAKVSTQGMISKVM